MSSTASKFDPSSRRLLLYGVTGYTGKLVLKQAIARGLRPVLAARNRERLTALTEPLGLEARVAEIGDARELDRLLGDIDVVVNLAGPFSKTARPMVEACLRTRTHYLDVTGEVPVLEGLRDSDSQARSRGLMIMPGVGFMVAATETLAARVARRLPTATLLRIGYSRARFTSRGSLRTASELFDGRIPIRRDGRLEFVRTGQFEHLFDFGEGPRTCAAMGWADVVTAYHSTGIPNVQTYLEVWPWERAGLIWTDLFSPVLQLTSKLLEAQLDLLPEGPSDAERAGERKLLVAEAEDAGGHLARSRMNTPDVYDVSAETTVLIAERALAGNLQPGVRTPAEVYGPEFLESLSDVWVEDLDP